MYKMIKEKIMKEKKQISHFMCRKAVEKIKERKVEEVK